MNSDLISIIVPCYNHALYIIDLLDSIYAQTYENIELIIIDDCSTDNSVNVINKIISSTHFRVRFEKVIFRKNRKNSGSLRTISAACRLAQGKYIFLSNSDDLFAYNRVEKMMNELKSSGKVWSFSDVKPIDRYGKEFKGKLPASISDVFEYRKTNSLFFPNDSLCFANRNIAISTGNLAFSASLIKIIDLANEMKYCGDYFICLCLLYLYPPAIVDEDLYLYRIHETNSFSQMPSVGEIEVDTLSILYNMLFFNGISPLNSSALFARYFPEGSTDAVPYLNFDYRRKFRLGQGVDIGDLTQWNRMSIIKTELIEIWNINQKQK